MNPELNPDNPCARKSELPYGILDFSKIKPEHIKPAFEAGLAQEINELEAIVNQPNEPTFENTVIPYILSGRLIGIVEQYFFRLNDLIKIDGADDIQNEYIKLRGQVREKFHVLNNKVFERIEKIYAGRESLNLDSESIKWLEEYYKNRVRQSPELSQDAKDELSRVSNEYEKVVDAINQNNHKETREQAVVVDDVAQLDGLTELKILELAQAAKEHGLEGKYLIELDEMLHRSIIRFSE